SSGVNAAVGYRGTIDVTNVPEPGSLLLVSLGGVGMILYRWGASRRGRSLNLETCGVSHSRNEVDSLRWRREETQPVAGAEGDERKVFMSSCLEGAAMPMTQQEKMEKCNADASAKALEGDDRKAFMSEYLKVDHKL